MESLGSERVRILSLQNKPVTLEWGLKFKWSGTLPCSISKQADLIRWWKGARTFAPSLQLKAFSACQWPHCLTGWGALQSTNFLFSTSKRRCCLICGSCSTMQLLERVTIPWFEISGKWQRMGSGQYRTLKFMFCRGVHIVLLSVE